MLKYQCNFVVHFVAQQNIELTLVVFLLSKLVQIAPSTFIVFSKQYHQLICLLEIF